MRHVHTALATILSVVGFAICSAANLAAGDPVVVKGTVKEVTAGEKGGPIVAEILVKVDAKGEYVFLLRKGAKVLLANKTPGQWSDLKADQRVSVTFNGIVTATDPPQAGADEIAIEVGAKDKQQR